MKTIIFKTLAVAIFSIASGLLFFTVANMIIAFANMINLALNQAKKR